MYKLTLTKSDRDAFDWIGDRYRNGNNMSNVFYQHMPEDKEWDDDGEITFEISESSAWEIKALAKEDNNFFPCFNDRLKSKMLRFIDSIV